MNSAAGPERPGVLEGKTASEALLARYLDGRGLPYRYEDEAGGARPDFWIEAQGGTVVCEVIGLAVPENVPRVGALDPYEGVRTAVGRKKRQGRGTKGRYPYVLVIRKEAGDPRPLDDFSIPGAMFGNFSITFPVGPGAPEAPQPDTRFGSGGRIQPKLNTRFSAVAVIHEFNPTLAQAQRVVAERLADVDDLAAGIVIASGAFEELERAGRFMPDLREVRLDVFHNPFAAVPLPLDVLCGPCDRQWGALERPSGHVYGLVAEGVLVAEALTRD